MSSSSAAGPAPAPLPSPDEAPSFPVGAEPCDSPFAPEPLPAVPVEGAGAGGVVGVAGIFGSFAGLLGTGALVEAGGGVGTGVVVAGGGGVEGVWATMLVTVAGAGVCWLSAATAAAAAPSASAPITATITPVERHGARSSAPAAAPPHCRHQSCPGSIGAPQLAQGCVASGSEGPPAGVAGPVAPAA